MRTSEVLIGEKYAAKVSGKDVIVRIAAEHEAGGWTAINLSTNRKIRIKSVRRLKPLGDYEKQADNRVKMVGSERNTRGSKGPTQPIWHQYSKYRFIFGFAFFGCLIWSIYSLFFVNKLNAQLSLLWTFLFWFPALLWARSRNRAIAELVHEMRSGKALAAWQIEADEIEVFLKIELRSKTRFHCVVASLMPALFVAKHFYQDEAPFDWIQFWFWLGFAAAYAIIATLLFYGRYRRSVENPIEVLFSADAVYRTGQITRFKGNVVRTNLQSIDFVSEAPPIIKVTVSERLGPHTGTCEILLPLNKEQAMTIPKMLDELRTSDSAFGKLLGALGNVLG